MSENQYDVVIIGAGPAGLSASLHLTKQKIHHLIIEKANFPRDKICGDAISGKVTSVIRTLNPEWASELQSINESFTPSWGVIFSSPEGVEVAIPFKEKPADAKESPGYIVKRIDFDHWLYQKVSSSYCSVHTGEKVENVRAHNDYCEIQTSHVVYRAKVVLAADGTSGLVSKAHFGQKLERDHHCAGLRAYYSGIKDLHKEGYIELHFVKESLPGYFWIFPLPNGQANVGIGMLSSYISKHKVDLKKLLQEVIDSPKFAERFKDADLNGKVLGWGLPLGSKKRELQKGRFILLGDAASLIDPFTGEGIGNAMISGRIAAEVLVEAKGQDDFDLGALKAYEDRVYNKLWGELRLSRIMQRLIRYPWLFNWVIRKIKSNEELKKTIMYMFDNVDLRKQFSKPSFYFKILFK